MVSTGRLLPAIRFEEQRTRVDDSLPRLDIGAFVGFATAGPFDFPVEVDSIASFRDVFGGDVLLARCPDGTTARGHLARAVEAFFESGGKVCWVVRVGDQAPVTRFPARGIVVADGAQPWRTPAVVARSAGSFADRLAVQPVLEMTRLGPAVADLDPTDHLSLAVREPVTAGDLLRLDFGDGLTALVHVAADAAAGAAVVVDRSWWFEPSVVPAGAAVDQVVDGGRTTLAEAELVPDPVDPHQAILAVPHEVQLAEGDVLVADTGGQRHVVAVTEAPRRSDLVSSPPLETVTSSGHHLTRLRVGATWAVTPTPPPALPPAARQAIRVDRLTLSLVVFESDRIVARLDGLGLSPASPRFVGALPSDEALFSRLANLPLGTTPGSGVVDAEPHLGSLWTAARSPRFPLSGDTATADEVWLPLAAALAPDAHRASPPSTAVDPDDALVRDGAAHVRTELFLDPVLSELGSATLLTAATGLAHLRQPPHRLRGIHSLVSIDAVSLLAVPDAVQPGWRHVLSAPPVVPPALTLEVDEDGSDLVAGWTPPVPGASYELEGAADPTFETSEVRYEGPATSTPLPDDGCCPEALHLRVRARVGHFVGPWSNTVSAWFPPTAFERSAPLPTPLELAVADSPPDADHLSLVWTPDEPLVEVEVSDDPEFTGAVPAEAASGTASFRRPTSLTAYYRVRRPAGADGPSPWSNTVSVDPPDRAAWLTDDWSAATSARLLDIHRGILRLYAARADVFAVLSVGPDLREPEIVAHVTALADQAGASDETAMMTFGALYHPWVVSGPGAGRLVASPPDGWALGTIAKRTLDRGAWIAPANVALVGAVGLHRNLTPDARRRLTEQGVNVVWREPAGISISTADTLSADELLRPIGVRRLLILLRRLAVREGGTYVFAPYDARFRALVRSQWERYLLGLFRRGAFAGATPSESYDLRVDDSVNPPSAVDAGRFVIEVAVAPSRPLEFLRVRLIATQTAVAVQEVVAA